MRNPSRKAGRPSESGTEQSRRFAETARSLGCDEDEAAFDEKLKVIARQKPKDELKPAKTTRRKPG